MSTIHGNAIDPMAKSKAGKNKPKRAPKPAPKPAPKRAKAASPAAEAINMRGLKCPLPALKTRKLLAKMAAGEILMIECTDPLTTLDIPNLLRETGDTLEGSHKSGRVLTFRIRKS